MTSLLMFISGVFAGMIILLWMGAMLSSGKKSDEESKRIYMTAQQKYIERLEKELYGWDESDR